MLNNIRNFSKTWPAKILLIVIIIPFVFWGMGGVFNRGNTNNIVKINNYTISTQDFINHLNSSNIDTNVIKENIDDNILEELLGNLISKTLIDMEIEELNIFISESSLAERIKKNKNFLDDSGKFSRTKYEKFLLSQNLTAPFFEINLKNNELKKELFSYVGGGIKTPFFLTNNTYKQQTGKLEIDFINLNNVYKKNQDFSESEIKSFINENKDKLKDEYIDFTYIKITPKDLTGSDQFNELFFKKIDELENKISNGIDFNDLLAELKITPILKKNYITKTNGDKIEEKIYAKRNENKIFLIDENEFYVLYQINKINKILPTLDNETFKNKVTRILYEKNKFEYNQKLLNEINDKKFNQTTFDKLADGKIENIILNSINDNNKFSAASIKLLYAQPINSFTLIFDEKTDVFVAKIQKLYTNDISKGSKEFLNYREQANIIIRDSMYSSYDNILDEKYNVTINQKTLERVKNYFR
jgi:peptidyl-prolyl cis-trans isomerase D